MNIEEIKKKIHSKMEELDKDQLMVVEEFIEKINSLNLNEWDLSQYVNEIVSERSDVLQKLAQ